MSLMDSLLLDPAPFDLWIALRADGIKGTGSSPSDPYDGSRRSSSPIDANLSNTGTYGREAIVTTSDPLGVVEGDVVTISGVTGTDQEFWNGTFPVYVVSGNSFRYWMRRKGTAQAPQTITVPPVGDKVMVAKVTYGFDDRMRELAALTNAKMTIHIGPGTFETRGFAEIALATRQQQLWQPRKGMNFCGSGIDVTTLKIVFADVPGANYYAIGGVYNNLLDYMIVEDLTVDSNLPGQLATPGKDYADVACSAVRALGPFTRIRRVKAINWGTQTLQAEAFVLVIGGSHPDYISDSHYSPAEQNGVNPVIEDCICVQPSENNQRECTVIHAGGGTNGNSNAETFCQAPILRRNFVDCAFSGGRSSFILNIRTMTHDGASPPTVTCTCYSPHQRSVGQWVRVSGVPSLTTLPSLWEGYFEITAIHLTDPNTLYFQLTGIPSEPSTIADGTAYPGTTLTPHPYIGYGFHALSMGGTVGGIVEDNVVLNVDDGGPHQDTYMSREIIVRRNYYKNVNSGPYFALGGLDPGPRMITLAQDTGTIAKATCTVPHLFAMNLQVQIRNSAYSDYNNFWTVKSVTEKTFTFDTTEHAFGQPPPTDSSGPAYAVDFNADVNLMVFVSGGFAEGTTRAEHLLTIGDRIKISQAAPSEYNGLFEITSVTATTFRYKLPSNAIGANASGAAMQRLWTINKLLIEDNIIELRQLSNNLYGVPNAISLVDGLMTPPPYVHGDVTVRGNTIRLVDGINTMFFFNGVAYPDLEGWGIFVAGAKRALISDNIIDLPPPNQLRDWRCGSISYLNNRTSSGFLVQGLGSDYAPRTDLEMEIDDATLLSL